MRAAAVLACLVVFVEGGEPQRGVLIHLPHVPTSPKVDFSKFAIVTKGTDDGDVGKRVFGDLSPEAIELRRRASEKNPGGKGAFDNYFESPTSQPPRKVPATPARKSNLGRLQGGPRLPQRRQQQPSRVARTPIQMKRKKIITAECGVKYTVGKKEKYKFKMPRRESYCTIDFVPEADVELKLKFKKFMLQPCDTEYLFLSDGLSDATFCNSNGPGKVEGLSELYIAYERNTQKKIRGSKLLAIIKAVKKKSDGNGGGGEEIKGQQICPNSCGDAPSTAGANRIVGGTTADEGEYPGIALLEIRFERTSPATCGGSIINSRNILTAAHCLNSDSIQSVIAVVGEHSLSTTENNEQAISATSFILHNDYDHAEHFNDIAILHLSEDISFSSAVGPICQAPFSDDGYVGRSAVVAGWGVTDEDSDEIVDELREVAVDIWSNSQCAANYKEDGYIVTSEQICASSPSKDSCLGDSGGPLMFKSKAKWYQVGLVSYGIGCARAKYPGVYTLIPAYFSWIESEIINGSC